MVRAAAPQPARSQPAHAGLHWRIWCAEAAGTALLVLGALSAVALVLGDGDGSPFDGLHASTSARMVVTGVLVGGCVSLIAVSPLARLSGAHINPAVTIAFSLLGRISRHDVLGYVVAQLAGAFAGALAFRALWGAVAISVDGGVTHPAVSTSVALALESGMTSLLVAAIFVCLSRERLARWTPLAAGALVATMVWQVGRYTGTSLNPARSEGPALVFGDLADLWLYLVAPCLGALAAAGAWRRCRPSMRPKTAKLFHDRRYPCSLGSELPAMGPDAPMPRCNARALLRTKAA